MYTPNRQDAARLQPTDILLLMREHDPEFAPLKVQDAIFLGIAPETQSYLYWIRYEKDSSHELFCKTIRFQFEKTFDLRWMGWYA